MVSGFVCGTCGLALTAAVSAGIIGLLLGIFISEHKKAAGPVLTIANIGYTIPAISLLGMLIPVWGSEIRRR